MTTISRHIRSNLVGYLALFMALTGSAYASHEMIFSSDIVDGEVKSVDVANGSVETADLKNDDVRSIDVRDDFQTNGGLRREDLQPDSVGRSEVQGNSLTGDEIKDDTLSGVASAKIANAAYSTFYDPRIPLPNSLDDPANPIVRLDVPAGSYVIFATLTVYNLSNEDTDFGACRLVASADLDHKFFDLGGEGVGSGLTENEEVVTLQIVHRFPSPGQAWLSCTDNDDGAVGAQRTKITAIQVASLSNVAFQR